MANAMSDIESIQRDIEETLLNEDFHCYDEAVKFREHCRALLSALAITREEGFNEAREMAADECDQSAKAARELERLGAIKPPFADAVAKTLTSQAAAIRSLSHTPQSIQKRP